MSIDVDNLIRDMRKRCRMAMDGMKSSSMRVLGLDYKLNFGLVIQQIKDIAGRYEANAVLADKLWAEDTRELIILSTFLYPIDKYTPDKAEQWVKEIPNQEIREQVCLNLFQELAFADQIALEWLASDDINIRTTGYWLLARLLLTKKYTGRLELNYFNHIKEDIVTEDIFLRNASQLALKHIGRQSKEDAGAILNFVSSYNKDENKVKQEAYNSLAFEFEFVWG